MAENKTFEDPRLPPGATSKGRRSTLINRIGREKVNKLDYGRFFTFMKDPIESGVWGTLTKGEMRLYPVLACHMAKTRHKKAG